MHVTKRYFAEFLSTYLMVLIGTGSVIVDSLTGNVTLAGISVITGAIVSVMIILLGPWSGAHMNPAVTLALATGKKFLAKDIIPYLISQTLGAVAASTTLRLIFRDSLTLGENVPMVNDWLAFAIEIVLTFFLMMTILVCAKRKFRSAPWLIGLAVAIGIFCGGNYSGGSMNPARSFGPAIMNHVTGDLWIYLSAPFIGAIIAVVVFDRIVKGSAADDLS